MEQCPGERDESLTREEVNDLRRNLSLLSASGVLRFYRTAHQECAPEKKPTARAVQQLVTAWKILRSWNWHLGERRDLGSQLRQELRIRNAAYASSFALPHVCSYGESAVVVYEPCCDRHGNFLDVSYRAILSEPAWSLRLAKVHTSAARSLPKSERRWRELDSCMSSDALLMNVFCHPGTLKVQPLCSMLGVKLRESPVFGFRARVPLANGREDRTEVDMKLGSLLVESKLTESDFQAKATDVMDG